MKTRKGKAGDEMAAKWLRSSGDIDWVVDRMNRSAKVPPSGLPWTRLKVARAAARYGRYMNALIDARRRSAPLGINPAERGTEPKC